MNIQILILQVIYFIIARGSTEESLTVPML